MACTDFSPTTSSDSELSEMEDWRFVKLEFYGKRRGRKKYTDDLLADEEWLELYERDRKEEEDLEETHQKRLNGTEKVRASNIASAENNTSLRHGFSSGRSHNAQSLQSGCYVMNYTRPIPFRHVLRLSNGFSNLDFPPLWKFKENSDFNQKQKVLCHFAQNYTKNCLSWTKFGS